jgi:hypothetical protein
MDGRRHSTATGRLRQYVGSAKAASRLRYRSAKLLFDPFNEFAFFRRVYTTAPDHPRLQSHGCYYLRGSEMRIGRAAWRAWCSIEKARYCFIDGVRLGWATELWELDEGWKPLGELGRHLLQVIDRYTVQCCSPDVALIGFYSCLETTCSCPAPL